MKKAKLKSKKGTPLGQAGGSPLLEVPADRIIALLEDMEPIRGFNRPKSEDPEPYTVARRVPVDVLMDAGCPQCTYKHITAALASLVNTPPSSPAQCAESYLVYLARAFINFTEYLEGYKSHLDYAMGLLVLAEQELSNSPDTDFDMAPKTAIQVLNTIRNMRLDIRKVAPVNTEDEYNAAMFPVRPVMARGYATLNTLGVKLSGMASIQAHFIEAMREAPTDVSSKYTWDKVAIFLQGGLPLCDINPQYQDIFNLLASVIKTLNENYFSCPTEPSEDKHLDAQ